MVTLILSNLIAINDYQKVLAVITLVIDIVSSFILLWRVIKTRNISDETLKKIAQKGKLNKRNLLSFVSELILKLEAENEQNKKEAEAEAEEPQKDEVKE